MRAEASVRPGCLSSAPLLRQVLEAIADGEPYELLCNAADHLGSATVAKGLIPVDKTNCCKASEYNAFLDYQGSGAFTCGCDRGADAGYPAANDNHVIRGHCMDLPAVSDVQDLAPGFRIVILTIYGNAMEFN